MHHCYGEIGYNVIPDLLGLHLPFIYNTICISLMALAWDIQQYGKVHKTHN